jgi:NAD(P)-dependent dehydrogenase (short-subunit alcohol dehydrogenase family)
MVKLPTITEANARLAADNKNNTGLICVFAGATGGIGLGTIESLAPMLHSATFYILGCSRPRFNAQHTKLHTMNPGLKIVFLEAEVSLISDIDAASKKILSAEKKVDYLYMSPACFSINVPQCTSRLLPNPPLSIPHSNFN